MVRKILDKGVITLRGGRFFVSGTKQDNLLWPHHRYQASWPPPDGVKGLTPWIKHSIKVMVFIGFSQFDTSYPETKTTVQATTIFSDTM